MSQHVSAFVSQRQIVSEYLSTRQDTLTYDRGISLANPTVMVIQLLGKKSIQAIRDNADVLRHIIKNV